MASEVLRGFADASGKYETAKDEILAVSGCLSTPTRWQEFTKEWQEYLKAKGFKPHHRSGMYVFHTAPFKAGSCKLMPPRLTFIEKKCIYRDLIQIILKHTEMIFGCAVLTDDYRQIEDDYSHVREVSLKHPGAYLSNKFIHDNSEWAAENNFPADIAYKFDHHDDFLGDLNEQFHRALKSGGPLTVSEFGWGQKEQQIELQAADVVAWECRKYWAACLKYNQMRIGTTATPTKLRPGLELHRLAAKMPHGGQMFTYKHIEKDIEIIYNDWREDIGLEIGEGQTFATIKDFAKYAMIEQKKANVKEKHEQRAAAKIRKASKHGQKTK